MSDLTVFAWIVLVKRAVDLDLKSEDDLDSITYDQLDSIDRDLDMALRTRDVILGCRAARRYYNMLH